MGTGNGPMNGFGDVSRVGEVVYEGVADPGAAIVVRFGTKKGVEGLLGAEWVQGAMGQGTAIPDEGDAEDVLGSEDQGVGGVERGVFVSAKESGEVLSKGACTVGLPVMGVVLFM